LKFLPARVYIQIANEQQRTAAQTLISKLQINNFSTPGIENVIGNAGSPNKSVVRYYKIEDKPEAESLVRILNSLNLGVLVKDNPVKITSNSARPRHFEVWFAKAS